MNTKGHFSKFVSLNWIKFEIQQPIRGLKWVFLSQLVMTHILSTPSHRFPIAINQFVFDDPIFLFVCVGTHHFLGRICFDCYDYEFSCLVVVVHLWSRIVALHKWRRRHSRFSFLRDNRLGFVLLLNLTRVCVCDLIKGII